MIGLITVLALGAYEVEVLRDAGISSNRFDLVIVGDGYRTQDQTKFTDDGNTIVNRLFASTPWKEYAGLFNVSIIHVVSNENGADNGSDGAMRDTALGSYFGCSGVDRSICFNNSAVLTVAAQASPQYDQLVVLVNDPKYGGSGGVIAALSTNTNAPEILIHELGHSVGGLADEYDDPYPAYPLCPASDCTEPNASRLANSGIKWAAWVEPGTPLPTPENQSAFVDSIGAFEGARYMATGLYRPKDTNCKMKILGVPYCSVCIEGLIRTFFNRVKLVDSYQPSQATTGCGPMTFSVNPVPISGLTYAWSVNGVPRVGGSSISANVGTGVTVSVKVTHSTTLVRNDPAKLLEQTVTFQPVTSSCDGGMPPMVDAGTAFDAGFGFDAGSAKLDAGNVESAGIDAGATPQLRPVVTATSEGCGCTSSSGTWLMLLVPTTVLALRSRHRSAAKER